MDVFRDILLISSGDMLSIIADLLSIAGVLLTIWIASKVGDLAKYYGMKGRLTSFLKDIRQFNAELSANLNSNNFDSQAAQETLIRCESTLKSVKKFALSEHKKTVSSAQTVLKKAIAAKPDSQRNEVRATCNLLISLESDLTNYRLDEKHRPTQ